jgi:hypothetical protein
VVAAIVVVVVAGSLIIGRLKGSEPVRVTNVPTPSKADFAACKKLSALLPATVGDGLKTRVVHPDSPLLHAWGTPAAVLRCGVGYPPHYDAAALPGVIDGIGWYSTEASDAVIFTTLDRLPRVSVAIPRKYPISFDILVSLSGALKQATTGS